MLNAHHIFSLAFGWLPTSLGSPAQAPLGAVPSSYHNYFDVQAHRGGRGATVENTLPAFAWALIDGATTLELDNGVTKDGVVVVWHDEDIVSAKCRDTAPAYDNDPNFPYVGQYIANLTLAQLRTLDCGSQRQTSYPLQLVYPGTSISTMQEVFDFVACADVGYQLLWNIESKIDAEHPERTHNVSTFVQQQHHVFSSSPYYHSITYQSFDWRSIVGMSALDKNIITSALIDYDTDYMHLGVSPWLAGIDLETFPGRSQGAKIAQAAHSIGATILSPSALSAHGEPYTTKEMVDNAHSLGLEVKPWTVNDLNTIESIVGMGVDGIITDYPSVVRRWGRQAGISVAPKFPKQRVLGCLERHLALQKLNRLQRRK